MFIKIKDSNLYHKLKLTLIFCLNKWKLEKSKVQINEIDKNINRKEKDKWTSLGWITVKYPLIHIYCYKNKNK